MPTKSQQRSTTADVDPLLAARTPTEILTAIARGVWLEDDKRGKAPFPSEEELAQTLHAGLLDGDHIARANERLNAMPFSQGAYTGEFTPLVDQDAAAKEQPKVKSSPATLEASWRVPGGGDVPESVSELQVRWLSLDPRPPHPLIPLVRGWQDSPQEVLPDRNARGIMPAPFAARFHYVGKCLPALVPPEFPGSVEEVQMEVLPAIEPDRKGTPALLLTLFSLGGGKVNRRGRASIEARLFVELLLTVRRMDRQLGGLKRAPIGVQEIVEQWLQWNAACYRPVRADMGGALRAGVGRLRDIWVPVGSRGGGFFPVLFSGTTGWGLTDTLEFVLNLPEASDVGPQVDRQKLRKLGKFAAAWHAYVSLVFEWDHYGGRRGRLIRPNRRVARRDEGGNLLDAEEKVIVGKGGVSVRHPSKTKRAIYTGQMEPNPARTRYAEYNADDLIRLCFEPRIVSQLVSSTRRDHAWRARKAIERIEQERGCTIERLGDNPRNGNLPWRVMPPDYRELPDLSVSCAGNKKESDDEAERMLKSDG